MKERLLKISEEVPATTSSESVAPTSNNGDSIDDFLNVIESSKPSTAIDRLNPNELKWIGTFHSIFLKILKEDVEKL